jgi:serine/threonine protein kinase
LDFGAARQVLGEASQSLSIILKQGFAPIEQYQTKGNQGQWTDIYALGATMYYCLTGKTPDAPMDRLEEDNLIMPENISDGLKAVMRKMLAVRATNRYQSVMELKQDLKAYGLIGGTIVPQVSQTHLPSPESAPVLKKKSFALPAALISACFVIIISVVIFIVAGGSADDDFIPADAGNIPRVTDAPLPAVTTEPPVTTTTPPPMPEPQYVRTVTLGQFEWNNEDAPETQQGWISDGYAGLRTSLTIQNFKQSRYLIIEFETVPLGNVNLYWNSELNPWSRYEIPGLQTRYIIDMTLIPNYNLYLESDEIRLLLGYYNSTWADLRLKDAYFANLD